MRISRSLCKLLSLFTFFVAFTSANTMCPPLELMVVKKGTKVELFQEGELQIRFAGSRAFYACGYSNQLQCMEDGARSEISIRYTNSAWEDQSRLMFSGAELIQVPAGEGMLLNITHSHVSVG
ncbi:hypothetical protein [Paenibacillus donghaensis]|uniref:Uncharacterized protein n=1 Tax=Paenibacillus donghaensis TaxID=414771 RepID=A0A2Z2KCR4_9BACL|nr:hypothetical protein [Paenibacillus donghaensis]ASA20743.1 hypothetical protein B9T62_08055 [Paenibacillus donghaensis]